jgi:hypothetical protein
VANRQTRAVNERRKDLRNEVDQEVRILQLYSQGLMSRRSAIEQLGYVEDVDAELKLIEKEGR